jgi:hypothetical protein
MASLMIENLFGETASIIIAGAKEEDGFQILISGCGPRNLVSVEMKPRERPSASPPNDGRAYLTADGERPLASRFDTARMARRGHYKPLPGCGHPMNVTGQLPGTGHKPLRLGLDLIA